MNVGLVAVICFVLIVWSIFRSQIKDGSVTTSMPWAFLLSREYYDGGK